MRKITLRFSRYSNFSPSINLSCSYSSCDANFSFDKSIFNFDWARNIDFLIDFLQSDLIDQLKLSLKNLKKIIDHWNSLRNTTMSSKIWKSTENSIKINQKSILLSFRYSIFWNRFWNFRKLSITTASPLCHQVTNFPLSWWEATVFGLSVWETRKYMYILCSLQKYKWPKLLPMRMYFLLQYLREIKVSVFFFFSASGPIGQNHYSVLKQINVDAFIWDTFRLQYFWNQFIRSQFANKNIYTTWNFFSISQSSFILLLIQ